MLAVLDFGPPERAYDLVFLHANGFNALTYRRVLAPLAADFRILALDQRGHGASTLTTVIEGRIDWNDFRDDLIVLLETLDVRGAVICGHSMGVATCLTAAARTPGRARRLVLFDPGILAHEQLSPAAQGPHRGLIDGREVGLADTGHVLIERVAGTSHFLPPSRERTWPRKPSAERLTRATGRGSRARPGAPWFRP